MPNIFLTNICNNNCEYCFTKEIMKKSTEKYMQFNKFKELIEFFDKNERTRREIRFLGGEPLLHPQLEKFIKYATVKKYSVIIFTNGLELSKHTELAKYDNLKILINVNAKKAVGEEKYNRLIQNIEDYPNKKQIYCGLTVFPNMKDIESIFYVFDKFNIKKARLGVAVPSKAEADKYNKFDYYREIKPFYIYAIKYFIEHNLEVSIDCNGIPLCLFTEEELKYFNTYMPSAKTSYCINTGDIFLDQSSSFCFGFNGLANTENILKYKDFKDFTKNVVQKYAIPTTVFREKLESFKKCVKCEHYKNGICAGGCKIFEIDLIKEFLNNPVALKEIENEKSVNAYIEGFYDYLSSGEI